MAMIPDHVLANVPTFARTWSAGNNLQPGHQRLDRFEQSI